MIPKGIALDLNTRKLQVVLAAAGTIPVTVCFIDIPQREKTDTSAYRPATQFATTNGTNAVDICDAPAQGTVRVIHYICVHDSDAGAETVTIKINDNSTDRIQVIMALATTESMIWTPESGWNITT